VDAHLHLIAGGFSLLNVDLSGADSREAFAAAVKTAAGPAKRLFASIHGAMHPVSICQAVAKANWVTQTALIPRH
jgi:predicted amidohydrolase YtcJ